jgi:hypothetical protein
MTFYYLEPEVAGWLRDSPDELKAQTTVRIHYEFEGWRGDVLLESFPCWIVTMPVKVAIESAGLTGATFGEAEVSASHQFRDFYPDRELPRFAWLKVGGMPGRDDFGISPNHILVVSEKALALLRGFGIEHAEIKDL